MLPTDAHHLVHIVPGSSPPRSRRSGHSHRNAPESTHPTGSGQTPNRHRHRRPGHRHRIKEPTGGNGSLHRPAAEQGVKLGSTPIAYTHTEFEPGCSGADPEKPCCPPTPITWFTSSRGFPAGSRRSGHSHRNAPESTHPTGSGQTPNRSTDTVDPDTVTASRNPPAGTGPAPSGSRAGVSVRVHTDRVHTHRVRPRLQRCGPRGNRAAHQTPITWFTSSRGFPARSRRSGHSHRNAPGSTHPTGSGHTPNRHRHRRHRTPSPHQANRPE